MIRVENRVTQDRFLRPESVIFKCQKYVRKWYIEMTKKNYYEIFKKCTGSLCFPLLKTVYSYQCSTCKSKYLPYLMSFT